MTRCVSIRLPPLRVGFKLRTFRLRTTAAVQGKDATFLCSLNNFDAYYVTRVHKAPKPYTFSVKSTDSLTYFENTSDYVHVFSCGESEGKNWLEKILLARVSRFVYIFMSSNH